MSRDEDIIYYIWLSSIKHIGPSTIRDLINKLSSPKEIFYLDESELKYLGLKSNQILSILENRSLTYAEDVIKKCNKKDIKILLISDEEYPVYVKRIKDIPVVLYYKGDIKKISNGIGIVGTRKCTEYGKKVTLDIVERLSGYNISIISGMAKGIDAYAHTAAIKNDINTTAFLGNGLDICYPSEHRKLMDKIIEKGVVISEHPPGVKPSSYTFPKRNMLIAAFSKRLIVAEAGEKSGSLITAKMAMDYKVPVFAVPNSIYNKDSIGCNNLIASGASIFRIDKIIPKKSQTKAPNIELDYLEKKIANALKGSSKTIDELLLCVDIPLSEIVEKVSIMEIEGKLVSNPRGVFTSIYY